MYLSIFVWLFERAVQSVYHTEMMSSLVVMAETKSLNDRNITFVLWDPALFRPTSVERFCTVHLYVYFEFMEVLYFLSDITCV